MKGILGILFFILALFILAIMLMGSFIISNVRKFRKAVKDAAEQQESRYREEISRQRQQYSQRQTQAHETYEQPHVAHEPSGETIIDNRHQKRADRKIFDDSDGEYVDCTEEK